MLQIAYFMEWVRLTILLLCCLVKGLVKSGLLKSPKHTSLHTREFIQRCNINRMKTPAESPDANPIENLWHEMKEYIRREVNPKNKAELVQGIQAFWNTNCN